MRLRVFRNIALLVLLAAVLPLAARQRPQGRVPRSGQRFITGTVFDDNRQPMAGIVVRAMRPTYDSNGAANLVAVGRPSTTDEIGRFLINSLPPDLYVVAVESSPTARAAKVFAPVYYPGGTDWRSSALVDVSQSSLASVDVYVPTASMVKVTGSIYNMSYPGARVTGFYVSAADDPSTALIRLPNTARDSRTSFQVEGLLPGDYEVFPILSRPSETPHIAHVHMTVPRNLQGVTMEILPGVDVVGQVHVRNEAMSSIDFSQIKVGLIARKGVQVSPPPIVVGPDGKFTIHDVAQMEYQVSLSGLPPTAYIESAQFDDADGLNSWVPITRLSQRLQIVVDMAGGEIHGTLVDIHRDRFASAALLVLVPVQRKGSLPAPGFVVIPTDRFGTFSVRAVPPGDYRLLAWSSPNGRPFFNAEFMQGYLGMGDVIHVYRGSRIQAEAVVVDAL